MLLLTLVGLALTCQATTKTTNNSAKTGAFIAQFIQRMVKKHHFKQDYLEDLFDQITINTTVTNKMSRPFEAKPWQRYRQYFVTDNRIRNGVAYWQKHHKLLKKAEKNTVSPPA